MKLVHHYTGDYNKSTGNREASCVEIFNNILEIKDPFDRQTFAYMLRNKLKLSSSGSHIYQIRED